VSLKKLKVTAWFLAACAVLVLGALAVVYGVLRASLPQLDGEIRESGLAGSVKVERDRRGVPTLEAGNRTDLAFATGFVHGQDRFFQMDLSRRFASGELSELFGSVALEHDRKVRLFRFKHVADEVLKQLDPQQRAVIEAYARGVNAGLANLNSRPGEYWVLHSTPVPWRAEDTILVVYSMWWDLEVNGFAREILRHELNERIGGAECESGWKCGLRFLYPARTAWDAPDESPGAQTAVAEAGVGIPSPDVLDVRGAASPRSTGLVPLERDPAVGSNGWAVAGRLTASGAALVANDMHLGQRVPIIWYHARLRTSGTDNEPALDLNGVTLPGAPLIIAGSNGHIAWGFTYSYGDWLDVERVRCTSVGDNALQTPSGPVPLSVEREEIPVHGASSVMLDVKTGPAGVLLLADPDNQTCWFGSWLAAVPGATNFNLMSLERVTSVQEALALAPAIGIPHENFIVGDRDGHIGWSIAGRVPTDTGPERANGRSPWTTAENHPRIMDPAVGRIWSANARMVTDPGEEAAIGADEASLGSEYDLGARAHQIRDDLLAIAGPATPADMLHIQLDDRAVFLTRWQEFLVRLIDDDSLRGQPARAEFKRLVANWDARAGVDSVGYRLVRAYHDHTRRAAWEMLVSALKVPTDDYGISGENSLTPPMQFEEPLWKLVTEQPMHLLAADYPSWREFLLTQLDGTIADLGKSCPELARCTWGSRRVVRIQHPLSRALPWLSSLLDMPSLELPGDHEVPRVQDGAFGASERFAVSPGHEDQGYFHMPGGQSGHPLSPYYRAGFMEWARGEPLPFLPGPPDHALVLRPER
jgi:penicillin amidase